MAKTTKSNKKITIEVTINEAPVTTGKQQHVMFVLDKSGSMSNRRDTVISSYNEYVQNLKNDAETSGIKYLVSLTEFNDVSKVVYTAKPLSQVPELSRNSYSPDGMTALHDALGQTIRAAERYDDDNSKVLVVIITDGQENSSREFTQQKVQNMVLAKKETNMWTFTYLGVDMDEWAANTASNRMGISSANTVSFTGAQYGAKMRSMANSTAKYACSASSSSETFFKDFDPGEPGNSGGLQSGTNDLDLTVGNISLGSTIGLPTSTSGNDLNTPASNLPVTPKPRSRGRKKSLVSS